MHRKSSTTVALLLAVALFANASPGAFARESESSITKSAHAASSEEGSDDNNDAPPAPAKPTSKTPSGSGSAAKSPQQATTRVNGASASVNGGATDLSASAPTTVSPTAPPLQVRLKNCTDVPPGQRHTCQQQRDMGKCYEDYMIKYAYCSKTCGQPPCCMDIPPNDQYTCAQQKEFNKCDADFMKAGNFCAKTCMRSPCPTSPLPTPKKDSTKTDSKSGNKEGVTAD